MPEKLIRHVVVVWDESEHMSARKLNPKGNAFLRSFMESFPEAQTVNESPIIASTPSPILAHLDIRELLHQGGFLPFSGANKDLALLKWCTSGLVDQDERYHFVLDDLRHRLHVLGQARPILEDTSLVVFLTTDNGPSMTAALKYAQGEASNTRVSFAAFAVDKDVGGVGDRMGAFGEILGRELRSMYLRNQDDGIVFDLPGRPPA